MVLKVLLSIFFLIFSVSTFAESLRDSVGVENVEGKKVILHKVKSKETYYSIGRQYKVNPKPLMDYNNSRPLKPGDVIKIPTNIPFIIEKKVDVVNVTSASPSEQSIIDYKVGPKETLFSIAKRFNTSVDDIKTFNRLNRNSLAVGQILKIKVGKPAGDNLPSTPVVSPPVKAEKADSNVVDTINDASARLKLPPYRYGLREVVERGVASTMVDENFDGSKMLALHATAPVGTIIKITNPMTNKTTFAKVVGKFTENEATKDVVIVINKATADLIGALDKRFQVTLVYGVPNE